MNGFALNNIQNAYVGSTPAQAIYLGSTLIFPTGHDYSRDYLTLESLEDNNVISFTASDPDPGVITPKLTTIAISTDDGLTWYGYTSSTSGTILATLNTGDKLLVKGNAIRYGDSNRGIYNYFSTTKNFNVCGNAMSLFYEDNFIGQTVLPDDSGTLNYGALQCLFRNCTNLINAENFILPATTIRIQCYLRMFQGCTSLLTAPKILPATTAPNDCYYGMFQGCASLLTAPTLPATIIWGDCYRSMFAGCTALTTAPELPATTLENDCYYQMFYGCTALTTAPELPATTLKQMCYDGMFEGCTSLNYIKCLATDISASDCTLDWLNGVATTGTFIKPTSMTSWNRGTSGIPSGWTVINI